jgi:hypothetical protein
VVVVVLVHPPSKPTLIAKTAQRDRVFIPINNPNTRARQWCAAQSPIRSVTLIRFLFTMNKNLIALTFLGLVAIFLGGCTTTTETTTTRTREQSSMYAR